MGQFWGFREFKCTADSKIQWQLNGCNDLVVLQINSNLYSNIWLLSKNNFLIQKFVRTKYKFFKTPKVPLGTTWLLIFFIMNSLLNPKNGSDDHFASWQWHEHQLLSCRVRWCPSRNHRFLDSNLKKSEMNSDSMQEDLCCG